jgi:hypothetical protein
MKQEYANVFAMRAVAKVEKAKGMGSKTTWSTDDHLAAMAECLAKVDVPAGKDAAEVFESVLKETYNVSAFAQYLAKRYDGTGHFVRSEKKAVKADAFSDALSAQIAALKSTLVAAKVSAEEPPH